MTDDSVIVAKIEDAVWTALEAGWDAEKVLAEVRAAVESFDA